MPTRDSLQIAIADHTDGGSYSSDRLVEAARQIALDHEYDSGELSLVVVLDPEIQRLNRTHLEHDWPTDVISFVFESETRLEGEVIVSLETASRVAAERQVAVEDELLLYIIHGMLHLVGYDDLDAESAKEMREQEQHYLLQFGVQGAEKHVAHFMETHPSALQQDETN